MQSIGTIVTESVGKQNAVKGTIVTESVGKPCKAGKARQGAAIAHCALVGPSVVGRC